MHLLRWSLVFAPRLVASLCECGFAVASQGAREGDSPLLFTGAVETDFTKTGDVLDERDWVRQQFNVSAKAGRGRYGKTFSVSNISPHGSARLGVAEQGIELRVNGAPKNDAVPGAEMDSARVDMHWGSYRAGLKLTAVRGTCAAFFWYFNDTQEIDMEFLSQLYDAGRQLYPVNLVVQSRKSMEAGYDASRTETFRRVNLSFDPTAGFHEYRFDYLPGRVVFYADSVKLAVMQGEEIPTNGGHLILQHWSNGDPMWSGGPPTQDALLLVSYVKAYFNSSQEDGSGWAERCMGAQRTAVCNIADVIASNASTGGRFLTGGRQGESRKDDKDSRGAGMKRLGGTALLAVVLTALMTSLC